MSTVTAWFRDTAERVGLTFVEAIITFAVLSGGLSLSWETVIGSGAVTAALVVLKQAVFSFTPPTVAGNLFLDTVQRVAWSAIQGAITVAAADAFDWTDGSAWKAAGAAGLMAALTLVKALIASRRQGTITPASLAPAA